MSYQNLTVKSKKVIYFPGSIDELKNKDITINKSPKVIESLTKWFILLHPWLIMFNAS
jgi:hypothetical protein